MLLGVIVFKLFFRSVFDLGLLEFMFKEKIFFFFNIGFLEFIFFIGNGLMFCFLFVNFVFDNFWFEG